MRKIYILLLFVFTFGGIDAQIISEKVSASAVEAFINPDGPFFFKDYSEPGFYVTDFNGIDTQIPTVFASGLWIGAKRIGEDFVRSSRSHYTNADFTAGPSNYTGTFNFFKVWKVTGLEINAHITDFEDGTIDEVPAQAILEWPSKGNAQLGAEFPDQDFAPFNDADGDGMYDPYKGDYPIISEEFSQVIPLEMAFAVFHDHVFSIQPIGIEVHVTMYSLDCDEEGLLDRAIFTRHKIINREDEIEELYIGHWTDFDLGCYEDDYLGCDPESGVAYSYNMDDYDGDADFGCPPGGQTLEGNPVVHGSKFLNQDMYSFMAFHNPAVGEFPPAMTGPQTEAEVANFLDAKWRDGTPMTQGGIGYNIGSTDYVNHLMPDDPIDADGWSMISIDMPPSDLRSLTTARTTSLDTDSFVYFDMVQLVTMDPNKNHLEKVALNLEEMGIIQSAYENKFADLCGTVMSTENNLQEGNISIYPNPALDQLTLIQSENIQDYIVYDIMGRQVMTGEVKTEQLTLNLDLNDGVYWIQCSSESTLFAAQKFIVAGR